MSGEQRSVFVKVCPFCGAFPVREDPYFGHVCNHEDVPRDQREAKGIPLDGLVQAVAQPFVPEAAVADAVRAERERVAEALRKHTVNRADDDGCLVPMNPFTSWREAADFIEQLPPADGNTEEEG